jgi:hypothetical protein
VLKLWKRRSILDDAIQRVLLEMQENELDSVKYAESMEKLERLIQLKSEETRGGVSPDTIAIVIGNLAGILIIVSYERAHVMVSKGLNFILRSST